MCKRSPPMPRPVAVVVEIASSNGGRSGEQRALWSDHETRRIDIKVTCISASDLRDSAVSVA